MLPIDYVDAAREEHLEIIAKAKSGIILDTRSDTLEIMCPYCGKKEKRTSYEKYYSMFSKEVCVFCDFHAIYEVSFIVDGITYASVSDETTLLINKLKYSNTLSDFPDIGSNINYRIILKSIVKDKTIALLNTKHKSKNVSNWCWSYLKGYVNGNV